MTSRENGQGEETQDNNGNDESSYEPEIHFESVVKLPLVEKITLEEEEDLMIQLRAKLYRFDSSESPSSWKERGTGDIKMLHHPKKNTVRIVMRRDKTLKICANHFITPSMQLQRPNDNRKNWWMWSTGSDFADEVSKAEIFAIKFSNEEYANLWSEKFTEGRSKIQNENHSDQLEVQNADSVNSSETDSSSTDESTSDSESKDEKNENISTESVVTKTPEAESISDSVSKLDIRK